jgi:ssDNA-binding Zn-finger/Zn-ribbon topoisomerase 1
VKRVASKGRNKGNAFYGCSKYPRCRFITADLNNLADDKAETMAKAGVARSEKTEPAAAPLDDAAATTTGKRRATTRARKTAAEATTAPVADGTVSGGRISRTGRGTGSRTRSTGEGASEEVWATAIAAEDG